MTTPVPAVTVRHPVMGDIRRTLDLIDRCEIAEYGEPDSDLAELTHAWEQIDLSRDGWLVFDNLDNLVGYGAVIPHGDGLQYDFFADPDWPDASLGRALLTQCDARAAALVIERDERLDVTLYVAAINERDRGIAESAGFVVVRYHYQMRIILDGPMAVPEWPAGVTVRSFIPGQDDRAAHRLIVSAFSWPDREPESLEQWLANVTGKVGFDPELWLVAETDDNKIIGTSLCYAYPEQGWIRYFAVDSAWRRRGIGTALLHQSFLNFKELGFETVGLGVRANNDSAIALYLRAGMHRARQYDEYRKVMVTASDND
jgi:mycothiol synthase